MKLNNKVYDTLKIICTIVLPAIGTLYFALSQVWGFSYGEEVVGTVAAVNTFIGACLGVSNYNYKKCENTNTDDMWENNDGE